MKRVVNMGQTPTSSNDPVNRDAIAKDVNTVASVVSISEEPQKVSRRTQQNVVPDTCPLCEMGIKVEDIKYYDVALLKKFISVRGKIIARSKSGLCAKHQRAVVKAIKRARYLALLPYLDVGI